MVARSHEGKNKGLVFNIQKFSLHDGAGIRTLVFFKGCPLICKWCSNPEGQSFSPELSYSIDKCIGTTECNRCTDLCGRNAIRQNGNGRINIVRKHCDNCGECVDACPSKALEMLGKQMTPEEIIKTVEEDGSFYVRSGGGITLSGGEPLSQAEFAHQLLKTAKSRGLNTAVETSGICSWEAMEAVGFHVDHLFFDIKCMDSKKHEKTTGVANELILENFKKFCRRFQKTTITVRTPVIPGVNDSVADIVAIGSFLKGTGKVLNYELLPYHRFGEDKYDKLGKKFEMNGAKPPSDEQMKMLRKIIP